MIKVIKKLASSDGLGQSILTVFGNSAATSLSAISMILISRLLGPEKFGEFTVGFAIVLMLQKINEMGLNTALLKHVSSETDNNVINAFFSLTIRYKLFFSVFLIILGILLTPWLAEILKFPNSSILLMSFTLGISAVYYEQLLAMLQSLHRFSQAVVINAIQAGSKLVVISLLFLFSLKTSAPIFAWYVLAPFMPLLFVKWLLPKWVKINFTDAFPGQRRMIFNVAKHSSVAFISAGIIENTDVLFVQGHLSTYETGLLGGVSKIAMLFSLLAYSLGNVLNARVARYKELRHLKAYIKKARLVVIATLLGFFAFLPFGKLTILLTTGPEYLNGVSILYILVAASFLAVACIPFLALFYTFNESWYFSLSGVVQLVIVVVGNSYFVPKYGLEAAAWTRLVARVFLFIFTVLTALFLFNKHYAKPASAVANT